MQMFWFSSNLSQWTGPQKPQTFVHNSDGGLKPEQMLLKLTHTLMPREMCLNTSKLKHKINIGTVTKAEAITLPY